MKKMILLLISLLSLNGLAARLTDGKIKTTLTADELQITPTKGYHLNAEAPAKVTYDNLETIFKPIQKTEQLFTFKVAQNSKVANLNYYVCDDKKTVCEQHRTSFEMATAKVSAREEKMLPIRGNKMAPLVATDGKPTLLVFSAPWCPACIRMQTETYPAKVVADELGKINIKKVNSDLVENFELSEKFHVKAIPTMVLLNSRGEEVYRWLDFQAAQSFSKSLAIETKKLENDSASLRAKATQGDLEAASLLGMREYNSLNCAEAVKWLAISDKAPDQKFKLAAEVSCAQERAEEDPKLKENYLQTLEKAMILTSSEWDQIRWFINWTEQKKASGPLTSDIKAKVEATKKRIEILLAKTAEHKNLFTSSTFGEAAGFEKEEMLSSIANIEGLLDQADQQKNTQERSIQLISKRNLSAGRPGEMLMAIAYLREAGETKKVNQMYAQLIKKYPTTYVYFEKYARFQHKNKNFEAALPLSEKAIAYTEGNAPQLYLLKSRILKDMNKKAEAKMTIEEALKLKDVEHPRFKKSLAQLKNLKEELNK